MSTTTQPIGLLVCWTILSTIFTCAGALWAVSPECFVKVWRRIAKADYYIASTEWEKSVVGMSGRLAGCVFIFAGLGGFYLLLKLVHAIK